MSTATARRTVDGLVVVLALAAQIEVWTDASQTPRALTAPAALLWTLPLLVRGRWPLAVPAVVFVTLAAESFLAGDFVGDGSVNATALFAAFYVAGTHTLPRRALAGGAVGYLSLGAIVHNDLPRSDSAVAVFLVGGAAWAIGRVAAERARRTAELEERARRLERDREAAALAERARIAGELHDVIAHSVSVMTIQAGAARLLLDDDPERAREPLAAVEETGHQALGEMRRLLGILRGAQDEGALAPQPGLRQLGALIEQVRAAGLVVDVAAGDEAPALPGGVDLTAYRVIQEALTNVLKHAGRARARVEIEYTPAAVVLEVRDTGDRRAAPPLAPGANGGHGLIGMRQRVELYGGRLEAGPCPDGGYRVRARIPLAEGSR